MFGLHWILFWFTLLLFFKIFPWPVVLETGKNLEIWRPIYPLALSDALNLLCPSYHVFSSDPVKYLGRKVEQAWPRFGGWRDLDSEKLGDKKLGVKGHTAVGHTTHNCMQSSVLPQSSFSKSSTQIEQKIARFYLIACEKEKARVNEWKGSKWCWIKHENE